MAPSNTAGNPLSAASLASLMAAALPKRAGPQIRNPYEATALAVHAGMVAVGFRLVGLGEDHRIEASPEAENPQALPTEWNAASSYAFRYTHSQSAMEYIVKVNRLGGKAVVFGVAVGDDKTTNFEITVRDYISESPLPVNFAEDTSTEDASRILQDLFISQNRLNDLGSLLKVSVIQRLAPGIYKEGYQEERGQQRDGEPPLRQEPRQPNPPPLGELPDPARPYPFDDPLQAPPRQGQRPLPDPIPGFEDEYEIINRPRGGLRDDRFPAGMGHNDLYPPGLGPHDPIRPHLGGGLPQPGAMGGGMHPTFDDPLFRGQGQGGYDPMAPPGARYDPVGPQDPLRDNRGGGPRFPGGGFPGPRGGGGGGFGGPPNPFGGFGGGDFI